MKQSGVFLTRPMLVVTVALVGLNLRPFITSIGPLIANIRTTTGLSLQGMAFLTLLPMMLMGGVHLLGQYCRTMWANEKLFLVHYLPFVRDVLSIFYYLQPKD